MNANELADEVVSINDAIESEYNRFKELDQAATMLRQQQAEIEALKAHFNKENPVKEVFNTEPVAWMLTDRVVSSVPIEGAIPLYTHPHPDNLGFAESIIKQQELHIAELEKELKRTKFAWNLAENELERYLIKVKAQEK